MKSPASHSPSPSPTRRRRAPWGIVWAILWIAAIELAARGLWRPDVVDPKLYAAVDASYNYGFEFARPACEALDEGPLVCRRTQYRPIAEQRLDRVKAAGTIRIFTLGGSHAAGGDAYTQRLLTVLRRRCPSRGWEGANLAVPGHGSRRTLIAAEEALTLDPDLLIVDFGGSNEYEDERDASYRDQLHAGIWALLLRSQAIVLGRKLLSRAFPIVKGPTLDSPAGEAKASRDPANLARWRASLRANNRATFAAAAAADVEVILVGRASLRPHAPGSRALGDHEVFAELAGEVPSLDAHALVQSAPAADRRSMFRDDRNHYAAAGHQAIAEALAERVLARFPCDAG
ncbi:MAG: SGNH/GDSL hydrolase family protein [Myxococcales bacterium]|nr:SGNH/GDSL hydrolase family protein [Myxococcales bacterium]